MKYAKIRNGRVVHTVNGSAPAGYVLVIRDWTYPNEYPDEFYSAASSKPILTIIGEEVHETWEFKLTPLEYVKEAQYKRISHERWQMEERGFNYGETIIPATLTAKIKIPEMPAIVDSFKVADGVFISVEDTKPLKDALIIHIQSGYKWENTECDKVKACTTHREIADLIIPN